MIGPSIDPSYTRDPSGCTAVAALITKDKKIYVVSTLPLPVCYPDELILICSCQANAGDSRIVLGVKGQAKPLSYDHKPQNDSEHNSNALHVTC